MYYLKFFFIFILAGVFLLIAASYDAKSHNWQTASRESVGIAPDPAETSEAVIQIYGARAFSWRGYLGIHTWIAVKPTDATGYTVYEVLGWRQRMKQPVLVSHNHSPDRRWYGNMPKVLADKRGEGVDALISRIEKAVNDYPYASKYQMWPGPNSNTFTAWVSRLIPELELDLPPTAIGKDFLGSNIMALAPSGVGFQFSFYGLLGFIASEVEGVEINLLGLAFGFDPEPLAIKLPIIGRINLATQD